MSELTVVYTLDEGAYRAGIHILAADLLAFMQDRPGLLYPAEEEAVLCVES